MEMAGTVQKEMWLIEELRDNLKTSPTTNLVGQRLTDLVRELSHLPSARI